MHIALALRRRVRFSRLGAPEGSKFRAGVVTNRKIIKFLGPEKLISKTDFQVKKYNFSPSAPKCTFDRSATRRVQVFCTSSLPCDAGFDFSGSERAKGSKKSTLSWPRISKRAKSLSNGIAEFKECEFLIPVGRSAPRQPPIAQGARRAPWAPMAPPWVPLGPEAPCAPAHA